MIGILTRNEKEKDLVDIKEFYEPHSSPDFDNADPKEAQIARFLYRNGINLKLEYI
jgi:hypothetical protein